MFNKTIKKITALLLVLGFILGQFFSVNQVLAYQTAKYNFLSDNLNNYIFDSNLLELTDSGMIQLKEQISPTWWDTSYNYRLSFVVKNPADYLIQNYPVLLEINSDIIDYGKIKLYGEDIRFINAEGSLLSYWIEQWDKTGVSKIWVKIDDVPDKSEKTFYLYYGNPSASSVANRTNTFNLFYEDFSSGSLDWSNQWDTNVGLDYYKDYYRVDRLKGGNLIKNRRSYYAGSSHDYFSELVVQVIKPYSQLGFWDNVNQNWIKSLLWQSKPPAWIGFEGHDWRFSMEMEEGAVMASAISGDTSLESYMAKELAFIHTKVGSTGRIDNLTISENAYEYGAVLSALAAGAKYFGGHPQYSQNSLTAYSDAIKVYNFIKNNYVIPFPLEEGTSLILRGYSHMYQAYETFADAAGKSDCVESIKNLIYLYQECQNSDGSFQIADLYYPVQNQLKADIALMLVYKFLPNDNYVSMVKRNIDWIIINRWDSGEKKTGGLQWSTRDQDNFYECHQLWFLLATRLLEENSDYNFDQYQAEAFGFLTDDNFAGVDWYVNNKEKYGPFFAYRAIDRSGRIMPSSFHHWKGSYEIGIALWSLAANYQLYDAGHAELITQSSIPAKISGWDKAIFTAQNLGNDNIEIQWDVKFYDPRYADAYTGLFNDKNGDWRVLLDTTEGFHYLSTDGSSKKIVDSSWLASKKIYTAKIFINGPQNARFVLLEDGEQIIDENRNDVADFSMLYFGALQSTASSLPAQNISVDNIIVRPYIYPGLIVQISDQFESKFDRYSTEYPSLTLNSSVAPDYTSLISFSEDSFPLGKILYQISPDGIVWYYFNGTCWQRAEDYQQSNPAGLINSNLESFTYIRGAGGQFFFKAFFSSDGAQQVQLSSINVEYKYEAPKSPSINQPKYITSDFIRWNFTDLSEDESGFILSSGDKIPYKVGINNELYFEETGLKANTFYSRHVVAVNKAGQSQATAENFAFTFARVPGQPIIDKYNTQSVHLVIDKNFNPEGEGDSADTLYAIQEVRSGKFVQANRTLGAGTVWLTFSEWGGAEGLVLQRLIAGQTYSFRVKAMNAAGLETDYSPLATHSLKKQIPSFPALPVK